MHELSVCQALIGQVERVARENDARRVISIVIDHGPLSGVEPQLLNAYPSAAAGTIASTPRSWSEQCRSGALPDLQRRERRAAEPACLRRVRRLAGGRDRGRK
jgi:Zn finger protein HypA/HybF involved in hydrogenase expression